MVDMSTGDLTYSIPILELPGPEGGFSLPLTYRAGIAVEQEATWVGLGWSLNAGAISRSINHYPDDASTEKITHTYEDKLNRGWYGGIPGGSLELGWDSETGHWGKRDFLGLASVSWQNGKITGGDIIGISAEGVDPVRFTLAIATIASAGVAAAGTTTASAAIAAIGQNLAVNQAIGVGVGVTTNALGMGGLASGIQNKVITKTDKRFLGLYTNYWRFINDEQNEVMYGTLYFQDQNQAVNHSGDGYHKGPYIYKEDRNTVHSYPRIGTFT
ncbi:MAG TPA: hypothetical protein VD772_02925, partial [Anseongella sp.]|nr:hypothetical protein [Anseongella sp.]